LTHQKDRKEKGFITKSSASIIFIKKNRRLSQIFISNTLKGIGEKFGLTGFNKKFAKLKSAIIFSLVT